MKENDSLLFNDEFETNELSIRKWIPYYLPQWSSKELSKPNYKIKDRNLILQITENQKPWCPEFNGDVKCSSVQTGIFSGALGSKIGQHSFFNPRVVVREEQENRSTFLQQYGYFEIRAKSLNTVSNVVSLWMIGYEDKPERCAEICVFEVKGKNVKNNKATIGYGIHKFNDPLLTETFYENEFTIDVTKFHIYAVDWRADKVTFYIDNRKIREIPQSPNYPMQMMLGVYEIPGLDKITTAKKYPKEFIIDYIRVYSHE